MSVDPEDSHKSQAQRGMPVTLALGEGEDRQIPGAY